MPSVLPKSGKIIEMEIVKSVSERIRFTPAEIEEFELKDAPNGSVMWHREKAKEREFRFEDSELEVVRKGITALDEKGDITVDMLSLVKKFTATIVKKKEVK